MSERAEARVGRELDGKWRLDRLLGVGGMGWVYAATHRNGTRAAIKMLIPELGDDPETKRRFSREGYVANTIGHPGVVMIYDDGVDFDGNPYLVMELLEGATLDELRQAGAGRIAASAVLAAAFQALDVLAAAHDKGVIHRDIKPSNMFVLREGRLKLLDFGIARLLRDETDLTKSGAFLGSVGYMAPEQARGAWELVDARSDIWAVGATMFRLLSSRHVHDASSIGELVSKAVSAPARSLSEVAPEVPKVVTDIVDRAVAFDPSARFPDARSMQRAVSVARSVLTERGGASELASLVREQAERAKEPTHVPTVVDLPDAQVTNPAVPRAGRPPALAMARGEAAKQLADFGIRGSDVHLIDTIPLIEMIWADGRVQTQELELLDRFLGPHVENINQLAGSTLVTVESARAFVHRFLNERPDPNLLGFLRGLLAESMLRDRNAPESIARRRRVLDFCLDIGSACVAAYPHGDHDRFCGAEKKAFEEIFRALG